MVDYDVIVIGAGPGGCEAATRLAKAKKSVCLIDYDKSNIGGVCLNEGCIPTKQFLTASTYINDIKHMHTCGIDITLNSINLELLQKQTQKIIDTLKSGLEEQLNLAGVTLRYAKASFINKNTISLSCDKLSKISAKNIIIATGSLHKDLSFTANKRILSSKDIFTLKKIPKSLLIIGGGVIGCEFASFFQPLGTKVSIVEYAKQLMPFEDEDVARTLKRSFEKSSINIYLNASANRCIAHENSVDVEIKTIQGIITNNFEYVLVAVGRIPNTKELNLQKGEVNSDKHGYIDVNDNLCSVTNPNVYAIGDVIATPALAHTAYSEARHVVNILLKQQSILDTLSPRVIFSTPQIASIGATQRELKSSGKPFKINKVFFKKSAKAKIKGDDSGFIRILHDANTNEILGVAIIGHEATELIHTLLVTMHKNPQDLSNMIFAHPTLSETIHELFLPHA